MDSSVLSMFSVKVFAWKHLMVPWSNKGNYVCGCSVSFLL